MVLRLARSASATGSQAAQLRDPLISSKECHCQLLMRAVKSLAATVTQLGDQARRALCYHPNKQWVPDN